MATPDFSLPAYISLINNFKDRGYRCKEFKNIQADKKHLIVRHDVDFSPQNALVIANTEETIGISAYYYFLIRSPFYNILNPSICKIIQNISQKGHHIGLHFDAALYEEANRQELERYATEECNILETATNTMIDTISFHRPAPALVGLSGKFANRFHTYDPDFIEKIGYCSDSRGEWRYQHPLQTEAVIRNRALQLLTHPIWWYSDQQISPVEKIQQYLKDNYQTLAMEAGENCTPYAEWQKRQPNK